jgi:hypothetical protein
MGDARRFDVFAEEISRRWPDRSLRIADVAGGKGGLHAGLYCRGYHKVWTFDTRHRKAHRRYYRHQLFTMDTRIREGCDLVVAMHPDEATDIAMAWAMKHRIPFAVVPCCIKPTAWTYWEAKTYLPWMAHLVRRAESGGYRVTEKPLQMKGRNLMLVGEPEPVPALSVEGNS